jgi:hypothetical protein
VNFYESQLKAERQQKRDHGSGSNETHSLSFDFSGLAAAATLLSITEGEGVPIYKRTEAMAAVSSGSVEACALQRTLIACIGAIDGNNLKARSAA